MKKTQSQGPAIRLSLCLRCCSFFRLLLPFFFRFDEDFASTGVGPDDRDAQNVSVAESRLQWTHVGSVFMGNHG